MGTYNIEFMLYPFNTSKMLKISYLLLCNLVNFVSLFIMFSLKNKLPSFAENIKYCFSVYIGTWLLFEKLWIYFLMWWQMNNMTCLEREMVFSKFLSLFYSILKYIIPKSQMFHVLKLMWTVLKYMLTFQKIALTRYRIWGVFLWLKIE